MSASWILFSTSTKVKKEEMLFIGVSLHDFKVHFILNEMIMGGMVLETNLQEIVSRFQEQQKIAKSEVTHLVAFYYLAVVHVS